MRDWWILPLSVPKPLNFPKPAPYRRRRFFFTNATMVANTTQPTFQKTSRHFQNLGPAPLGQKERAWQFHIAFFSRISDNLVFLAK